MINLCGDLLESIKPNNDLLSQTIYTNVCAGHKKKRMAGLIAWMSVSLLLRSFVTILEHIREGYIDSSFLLQ